jgi:N-acetylmuramic acid 6-phosphate etherase
MPPTDAEGADRDAQAFLARAADFRLGSLVTESSHTQTRGLSGAAADDPASAIAMLQRVDRDLVPVVRQAVTSDAFSRLEQAFDASLGSGGKIVFTGCGATGRLALQLESMWRWACHAAGEASLENRVFGVMAGGDFALIKSVEGFEDHASFGQAQLTAHDVGPSDTVVAITEGGETTFVIGTAWAGLEAGAETFFVYNNPDELLRPVQRSREVLDEPRIHKLNLTTGPMAVAGSTRMQATSVQLAVVGFALERSLDRARGNGTEPVDAFPEVVDRLLTQLASSAGVSALARWTQLEASVYRREPKGRVLYRADRLMFDVMTDTTERSPTFSLPPFRRRGEHDQALSWSFVKHPWASTPDAWRRLLGRPIRGLRWDGSDYAAMGAPRSLIDNPPALDAKTLETFEIGCESSDEAYELRVAVAAPGETWPAEVPCDVLVQIGGDAVETAAELLQLPLDMPSTALDVPVRLAAKLALNTVSTASMAAIGRLDSNWMVHVRCANMKLIDRGIRLLMDRASLDYESACRKLFASMRELDEERSVESPVAHALERLRSPHTTGAADGS